MSGTFTTISTALSALRYNRVGMDIAAGNVANVGTEGYTRRRVEAESLGAPARPAMWSRHDASGYGVRVSGVTRMADPFLDARARFEHGSQSYLDVRRAVLERVETGVGEPGDNGVAAAMAAFRQSWHDVANNPGSDAARNQTLVLAGALGQALGLQAANVTTEASDQRFRLQAMVAEVNTVATDLAATNEAIAVARLNGGDAGTLLDQRDLLAMRLAELTGGRATEGVQGNLDVTVDGHPLVTGKVAASLVITNGVAADGSATPGAATFGIRDASGTLTPLAGALRGEIGATADLLSVTLPAYLSGLNAVARSLADSVNAQHALGYDASGAPGSALFAYDPANAAATLTVAVSDPGGLAASALPGGVLDAGNAELLGRGNAAEGQYQQLVNGFGAEVASVRRLAANQQVLTTQVDGSREELGGVDLDEEMLTMLTHQRAYEAAAKVLSTVDSVLDTLINRTGLLR